MELSADSERYLRVTKDHNTGRSYYGLLTVITHKGLYTYQRLTYVIASARAIFQSTIAWDNRRDGLCASRIDNISELLPTSTKTA